MVSALRFWNIGTQNCRKNLKITNFTLKSHYFLWRIVWIFHYCLILLCGGSKLTKLVQECRQNSVFDSLMPFSAMKKHFSSKNRLFWNYRKPHFAKKPNFGLKTMFLKIYAAETVQNWFFLEFLVIFWNFLLWLEQKMQKKIFSDNPSQKCWDISCVLA